MSSPALPKKGYGSGVRVRKEENTLRGVRVRGQGRELLPSSQSVAELSS